jgi:hypothetical protein
MIDFGGLSLQHTQVATDNLKLLANVYSEDGGLHFFK